MGLYARACKTARRISSFSVSICSRLYISILCYDMPNFIEQDKLYRIMRLKADLLLLMVAVIWGTAFVAQGVAGQHKIAYLFNGVSFMLAALILIPFVPRGTQISKEQWQ